MENNKVELNILKINDKEYEIETDNKGVEYFKPNNLIKKMTINFNINASQMVRLCELGAISLMDLHDWYAAQGHSVCRVSELSLFHEYYFDKSEEE